MWTATNSVGNTLIKTSLRGFLHFLTYSLISSIAIHPIYLGLDVKYSGIG